MMSQTRNLQVSLSWTLDERDSLLPEDLNEDIPRKDGKNRAATTMSDIICILYLGL